MTTYTAPYTLYIPERRKPIDPPQLHREIKAGVTRGPNLTALLVAVLALGLVVGSVLRAALWLVR